MIRDSQFELRESRRHGGFNCVNMGVEHCALVKAWISFYHERKEGLRYGQTGPVQNVNLYSTIGGERGGAGRVRRHFSG